MRSIHHSLLHTDTGAIMFHSWTCVLKREEMHKCGTQNTTILRWKSISTHAGGDFLNCGR